MITSTASICYLISNIAEICIMTVLFLNGCSSSGKTMVARAVQHLSDKPWLRVGVDTFIDMMPDKYIPFGEQAKEGFEFIAGENANGATVEIKCGDYGRKFFDTTPNLIATIANNGLDLIVDEVLFADDMLKQYVKLLTTQKVYFIKIACDLKVMQEREILRRDRAIGLANAQTQHIDGSAREYDITIDTTNLSAFNCAQSILDFIQKQANPTGFKKLEQIWRI